MWVLVRVLSGIARVSWACISLWGAHAAPPAISSDDTVGRLLICPNEVLITFHSSLSSVLY